MKTIVWIAALILSLQSCSLINKKLGLADDNIGEEIAEAVIKEEFGVDVDLTHSTPEEKK